VSPRRRGANGKGFAVWTSMLDINKPFSFAGVARRVREALDAKA
jgi:hypothetical protein